MTGPDELRDIARFLAGVGRDIPWHISRFHPDYQIHRSAADAGRDAAAGYAIGKEEGLHYVYIGNILGESEDTICPKCGTALIKRRGFSVSARRSVMADVRSAERKLRANLINFKRGCYIAVHPPKIGRLANIK